MVYPTDPGNGIHTYVPGPDFPPQGTVACLPLRESDAEGTARLYSEVFLADEPTTHRRSPDPALFLHYAILYARSLAGKKLSFVARDDRTGEPVGFIFCVDMTDDPKREGEWMVELLAYFREVVTMIDELEDRYLDRDAIAPGSVLHIFQIGVSRQYRGHGIAQALIRRVLAHARERGYRQVIADCTNPASRRSFGQCGFHEAGSLPYDAFSLDGVRFFAGIEGGISLMVRDV